jgi:hypothetical protein
MASLRTPTSKEIGSGVVRVLTVTSCVTGDTVSYSNKVGSFLVVNKTTTDAASVTWTPSTKLFTVTVANTPDIDIWVLP